MELTLAQVAEATGATLAGNLASGENIVRGWSIDSRTAGEGDLFFAIKGEHRDGHDFVRDVLAQGAAGAVVSEEVPVSQEVTDAAGPLLRVRDTVQALQQIAAFARNRWPGRVVGVTGSAGKTSTKDIVAACLGVRWKTGKTVGNFNNHLGLPLSLLRVPADADVAVLELGMNHAGEIRQLAAIAKPEVGVITNVGYAHIEFFQSIDGIAAAKQELIEALPTSGVAVLNADDQRVRAFAQTHSGPSITYGLAADADVRAVDIEAAADHTRFSVSGVRFDTHLSGEHSIRNQLAGIAVAGLFGIEPGQLVSTIAALEPGKMRGERRISNGITILNDSYNSNPEAVRSMLQVLANEPAGRRIAVLGEMLELGAMSETLHRQAGATVAAGKVDLLVGISGAGRFMVEEAINRGVPSRAALYFDDPESAGAFLRTYVQPGDAVLFKGSRGTHVEVALATMES